MNSLVIRTSRDVIEFVNSHPTGSNRGKFVALLVLGSIFIDAYDFTSLAIGVHTLQHQMSLSSFALGNVTAFMAFGALVGAFAGGYLVDRLGRFKLLILDLILFVVSAIGAALAPNLAVLLVFRFLLGAGVGVDMPASLSFVTEFSRSQDKGKYVNFWQLLWYVATVCSAAIALPFYFAGSGDNLWRWAVGFGAVPALVILVLRFIYADESPMWAAHHQGLDAAAAILRRNYHVDVTVQRQASTTASTKVPVSSLFRAPHRARTILASALSGLQAMEYYAVGFYLPVIAALIFGKGVLYAVLGTIVINVFGLLGGGTQPFLTRRLGLWKLATIGCCIAAAALILVGTLQSSIPAYVGALLVGLFIFGHSFGPGSQGKTMAALSYPTQFRGVGTGWAEAMSRVGSIFGFYVFPLVLVVAGLAHTLLILAAIPLLMLVALLTIRWEPVGQDVEVETQEVADTQPIASTTPASTRSTS